MLERPKPRGKRGAGELAPDPLLGQHLGADELGERDGLAKERRIAGALLCAKGSASHDAEEVLYVEERVAGNKVSPWPKPVTLEGRDTRGELVDNLSIDEPHRRLCTHW